MNEKEIIKKMYEYYKMGHGLGIVELYQGVKKQFLPKVHEAYAILMLELHDYSEAYEAISIAIPQYKEDFLKKNNSISAYSYGLSNYNALIITKDYFNNGKERLNYLGNAVAYLSYSSRIAGESKDAKDSGEMWWMCGWHYLPHFYFGEISLLNVFSSYANQFDINLKYFQNKYCSYLEFGLAKFFIEKEITNLNSFIKVKGPSVAILNLLQQVELSHHDTIERMRDLQLCIGNVDQELVNNNFEIYRLIQEKSMEKFC